MDCTTINTTEELGHDDPMEVNPADLKADDE